MPAPPLAAALCLALLTPGSVTAGTPPVEPAWIALGDTQPRWAVPVAGGASVLVATADNSLHKLDAASGQAQWPKPPTIAPGTQLAGGMTRGDVACLFNRTTLLGFSLTDATPNGWQYGAAADPNEFLGDPDVLDGWQAATLTPHGLLAANRDGTVILLDPADGRRVWEVGLPRWATVKLCATSQDAVVLAQRGGRTAAWRLDLAASDPAPRELRITDSWPIWAAATPQHLVLASPAGLRGYPLESGSLWRFSPPDTLQATGLAVWSPSGGAGADASDEVVLVVQDGALVGLNAATGARRWRVTTAAEDIDTRRPVLGLVGNRVWLASAHEAVALDLAHRRITARLTAQPPARLVAAQADANGLYGLVHTPVRGGSNGHWQLRFARVPFSPGTAPMAATLDRVSPPRAVCWSTGHMIIVAADGLQAYALPTRDDRAAAPR